MSRRNAKHHKQVEHIRAHNVAQSDVAVAGKSGGNAHRRLRCTCADCRNGKADYNRWNFQQLRHGRSSVHEIISSLDKEHKSQNQKYVHHKAFVKPPFLNCGHKKRQAIITPCIVSRRVKKSPALPDFCILGGKPFGKHNAARRANYSLYKAQFYHFARFLSRQSSFRRTLGGNRMLV